VLAAVAGCNGSEPAKTPESDAANAAAQAEASLSPGGEKRGILNTQVRSPARSLSLAAREEEKKGPTRQARCRINDEPEQPCAFTPVLGDGSFDIEMPDRQLRLIVSGSEAAPFERVGERRIPIVGLLQRDAQDAACWVSDDPDAVLKRVCAR